MKSKKLLLSTLLLLGGISTYLSLSSNSGGMMGVSTTGCGGSTCHASSTATTMTLTGIPITGYVAGTTYTMVLTVMNTTKAGAGFDLTTSGGTISGAPANTMLMGGTELHHTAPLIATGGAWSWTFSWTAPTSSNVTFSVAGNAINNSGNSSGDAYATATFPFTLASSASAPTITAVSATGITSTGATINASVNAHNSTAAVGVEYGLTTSYGSSALATPSTVSGSVATPITATLSALTPNTTYHYRVTAGNTSGVTNGTDMTFKTLGAASVNDLSNSSFKVYPNPSNSFLTFTSETEIADIHFNAITLNGATCKILSEKINEKEYRINIQSLATGNYILQATKDGKQIQVPFTKN